MFNSNKTESELTDCLRQTDTESDSPCGAAASLKSVTERVPSQVVSQLCSVTAKIPPPISCACQSRTCSMACCLTPCFRAGNWEKNVRVFTSSRYFALLLSAAVLLPLRYCSVVAKLRRDSTKEHGMVMSPGDVD